MARRRTSTRTTRTSRTRRARRSSPPTLARVLVALAFLLVAYLIQNGTIRLPEGLDIPGLPSSPVSREPQRDSTGEIEVFFTTPWLVYPDVPAQRRPQPFEERLIADIDAAQRTVDMAVFEYNLISLADALVRAQERGVQVRMALDRENLEKPDMADWAGRLEAANIPIAWEDSSGFLHSKFVIVDEALVWTGSWNASNNDTYRNNNNLLRITAPSIVENYQAEFAQMAEGRFGNSKQSLAPNPLVELGEVRIENYFSPQDRAAQQIIDRVNSAEESVRFMTFAYTNDAIAQAMIDRRAAGATVQGVFERRNAGGQGAVFGMLVDGGVDVLEDGNCYTMHHKVIIIDDRTVITGSYNFTARAERTNDENFLIIDDPTLAGLYVEEFERVYRQAREQPRCG